MASNIVERIPIDVLREIFLFIRDSDPVTLEDKLWWIPQVTHICKRWREVGLNHTVLWADGVCDLVSQDATDTILERARNAPLKFYQRRWRRAGFGNQFITRITPYQLSLAIKHISSVDTLFHADPYDWSSVFSGKTLPRLRALGIRGRDTRLKSSNTETAYTDEFIMDAPMLNELTLYSIFFSANVSALRYLKIGFSRVNHLTERISPDLLLSFLNHTPLLEELDLCFVAKRGRITGAPVDYEVVLPKLRKLRYQDFFDTLSLWRSVIAPPSLLINVLIEELCEWKASLFSVHRSLGTSSHLRTIVFTYVNTKLPTVYPKSALSCRDPHMLLLRIQMIPSHIRNSFSNLD